MSREVNMMITMERDETKVRGAALRAYLQAHLPVPAARSVTALARAAGLRPTTVTSWWTKGYVPDNASLRLLADALGVELSDLVAAYEGSAGRTWVFSDPELEALIGRAVETAVRRVLTERERGGGEPGARPGSERRSQEKVSPRRSVDHG
jgi:transcriptional regulator with XRE-family HTH domain